MRGYDRTKVLISIHVPKTGGTTFRRILRKWFGENLSIHYFNERENRMPVKHKTAPGICIHGHFNKKRKFGVRDYYPEARQFISFLRDPFDIVLSRFFFVKQKEMEGASFREGEWFCLPDDVNRYLEKEITQTAYHPNILDYMPFEFTRDNYKELMEQYFIYIGFREDFQSSVDIMAGKLGFSPVKLAPLNVSSRYQEAVEEYREIFMDSHPLEYMIYNYARQIHHGLKD